MCNYICPDQSVTNEDKFMEEKLLKIDAKIFKRSVKQILKQRCKIEKINRPTKPEEVANLVYKLIKDKNSNFKKLSIDGGKIKNLR